MRASFPIVSWQFLPSEDGAGEANDAENTGGDGRGHDRRAGGPDAAVGATAQLTTDRAALRPQNLSREIDDDVLGQITSDFYSSAQNNPKGKMLKNKELQERHWGLWAIL